MNAFHDALNNVLKYADEPTTDHAAEMRKGFEDKIAESPRELTAHLTYADWLRENGHEDEADFRQQMGEWASKNVYARREFNNGFPYRVALNRLPKGVDSRHLPTVHVDPLPEHEKVDGHQVPKDHTLARVFVEGSPFTGSYDTYGYRSYKGMDDALKRAYFSNKSKT